MLARHLPRHWLMTDERMGEGLWPALARLPRGSGVVFRHYTTPAIERQRLFAKVARIAKARRLILVRAGAQRMSGEDGTHNRPRRKNTDKTGLCTFAVHNRREAIAARRAGADLVFVSPVFATRSHPDAQALGVARLRWLIRGIGIPAVALGGMDARRFRRVRGLGLWGWAGIDAWTDRHDVRERD